MTNDGDVPIRALGGSMADYDQQETGIKLVLPLPPSSNRYWRYVNGRVLKSAEAKEFAEKCYWLVKQQSSKPEPLEGPVSLVATVYFPNKRGDLDNRIKQCLDGLQKVAYKDDKQVQHLEFTRAIDKENPRVEVAVTSLPEGEGR